MIIRIYVSLYFVSSVNYPFEGTNTERRGIFHINQLIGMFPPWARIRLFWFGGTMCQSGEAQKKKKSGADKVDVKSTNKTK